MEKEISFQNNGKLKLFIIVGTRPEIIRLSEVIKKCRVYFDTVLVHTGQNYDYNLNGIFSVTSGLPPRKFPLMWLGGISGKPWGTLLRGHTA